MSNEQYKFRGHGRERTDGNRARRLERVRDTHQESSGSESAMPRRVLVTFSGSRIKTVARELRAIRAAHAEAVSKETILPFVQEDLRQWYGRAIDVMLQVHREGQTIYDLNEAVVSGEILPDGTVRELKPECKYFGPKAG